MEARSGWHRFLSDSKVTGCKADAHKTRTCYESSRVAREKGDELGDLHRLSDTPKCLVDQGAAIEKY